MKNSKSKKKFLLTLGLGLGAVATVVPIALSATSCSTDESSKYKELIGRNVKWTDKEGTEQKGTLVKVDGGKIWIDKFGVLTESKSTTSNIHEFALPLGDSFAATESDKSATKDEVAASLTILKAQLVVYTELAYKTTEESINAFIKGTNNDGPGTEGEQSKTTDEAKSIAKEMLTIFKEKMTTLTSQKLDEAISDVSNNSLKKLNELISYYVDTFVWAREDFFAKYNELLKKVDESSKQIVTQILGNVLDISGNIKAFFNTSSTLRISK